MTGVLAGPAALSTGFGHAHEMLLGYALAVVAGNQLSPMPARVYFCCLQSGRSRACLYRFSWRVASVLDVIFIVALGCMSHPLVSRCQKLRNQAFPGVLTALCVAAVAYDVSAFLTGRTSLRAILTAVMLLLAALMLFMGGRIIAPAAAGQLSPRPIACSASAAAHRGLADGGHDGSGRGRRDSAIRVPDAPR